MDKYEFNIKVEQIKKMTKAGDYLGAMKAADEIDWRRVGSVNLLTLVSEIYEKNKDYAEAKAVLLLAYDKAPTGKRLLYKLTMLALGEGNVLEAEAYYREFYDLAPDDSRQHILRYLILKEKGAPVDQLISSLEQYTREELDEKWMYELAELYHRAGRSEECVAMCDKVMLMFGIGKYVDRALDLKLNREGQPLNEYQQNLIENRDRYEARLDGMDDQPYIDDQDTEAEAVAVPQDYESGNTPETNGPERAYAEPERPYAGPRPRYDAPKEPQPMHDAYEAPKPINRTPEEPQPAPNEEPDEIVKADISAILGGAYIGSSVTIQEEDDVRIDRDVIGALTGQPDPESIKEDEPVAAPQTPEGAMATYAEAMAPRAGALHPEAGTSEPEITQTAADEPYVAYTAAPQVEVIDAVQTQEPIDVQVVPEIIDTPETVIPEMVAAGDIVMSGTYDAGTDEVQYVASDNKDDEHSVDTGNAETEEEAEEMTIYTVNFIVERRKEEDGVNAAVRLLKLMHEHTGSHNQVAKIKAGKLNTLGVLASKEKLAGKDLVIEQAGDLAYSIVEEVMELIKIEPTERVVVLIDNPMQIRKMLSAYPELLQLFHVDKEEDSIASEPVQEAPKKEPAPVVKTAAPKSAPETVHSYNDDYYEETPAPAPAPIKTQAGGASNPAPQRPAPSKMNEEMGIDEFVDYAQDYAISIDCFISRTTKLAIYERVELMEEDGIKLTRENAVALVEEAADKAEKKGFSSLFKAKYDKDDKLILREEHFVK